MISRCEVLPAAKSEEGGGLGPSGFDLFDDEASRYDGGEQHGFLAMCVLISSRPRLKSEELGAKRRTSDMYQVVSYRAFVSIGRLLIVFISIVSYSLLHISCASINARDGHGHS